MSIVIILFRHKRSPRALCDANAACVRRDRLPECGVCNPRPHFRERNESAESELVFVRAHGQLIHSAVCGSIVYLSIIIEQQIKFE